MPFSRQELRRALSKALLEDKNHVVLKNDHHRNTLNVIGFSYFDNGIVAVDDVTKKHMNFIMSETEYSIVSSDSKND